MNRWQITLLVVGVIAIHGLLFWWIAGSIPSAASRVLPPPSRDRFAMREQEVTDNDTGEKYIYREFLVSTKLAYPDFMMESKAPPAENPYRLDLFPLPMKELQKRD